MSLHKSLTIKGKLVRQRNVFSRAERIEILRKERRFKEGDSVFGLPKVRTGVKLKKAKAKKEAVPTAEAAAATGAAPAAGAAAPAAAPAGKGAAAKPEGKGKEKGGKK
jgi:small basic protein (TIGR04137 family)